MTWTYRSRAGFGFMAVGALAMATVWRARFGGDPATEPLIAGTMLGLVGIAVGIWMVGYRSRVRFDGATGVLTQWVGVGRWGFPFRRARRADYQRVSVRAIVARMLRGRTVRPDERFYVALCRGEEDRHFFVLRTYADADVALADGVRLAEALDMELTCWDPGERLDHAIARAEGEST